MRMNWVRMGSALALLGVGVLSGYLLLGETASAWTGWAVAGSVVVGAWLGWAVRQTWLYPAILGKAEALWASGAPASQVAAILSRASLATGELGYRIHLLRGTVHLSLGDRNRAWLDFLQAQLSRLPLWKRLLVARVFQHGPELAPHQRLLRGSRIIRMAPQMAHLQHLQGILLLRSGSAESLHQAWIHFEAALPLAWDDPMLLEDLMVAGFQHGQEALAESALALLVTRHGDPRLPWDRGTAGMYLLRNGRYAEALALVQGLPSERRHLPQLWLTESVARRQLGDREGAWRVVEAATQHLPTSFRLWMERHQIALELHRDEAALQSLDQAAKNLPSGPEGDAFLQEWRLRRAEFAFWWEDHPDYARKLLEEVPTEWQGDHRPPLRLQIQVALGNHEAAYRDVLECLLSEPTDPDLLLLKADCLAGMETWAALLPFLDGLPEVCRDRPGFWHLRGLAQANLGDHLRARLDLERAVHMDQHDLRFLLDAGHACSELGDWDRAENHWRQALQIEPQAEEALIHLAEARQELGDLDGARRYLRECLLHHPDSPDAQTRLAELESN